MTAVAALPQTETLSAAGLYRLTVEQYRRMDEVGVFDRDNRVELLEGLLIRRPPIKPPHASTTYVIQEQLSSRLPGEWILRIQFPITLSDSEPLPDGVVVRGPKEQYFERHPGPADIALVIEVADVTLDKDRGLMQRVYARARIPVYWIVNIPERQIKVYTLPRAGKSPQYRQRQVIAPPASISFQLGGATVGPIPAADLLLPVSPA